MLSRIKTFIEYKGISVRKFEIALGMANGAIHNATVKGSSLTSQWITKMLEVFPEVNPAWLMTGQGNMLVVADADKSKIPYYNVDFTGGFVELYNDQTQNPINYIDCQDIKGAEMWCNIKGHSMEPTITDGDRIALKNVGKNESIKYGHIYAVVTNDGLRTVKRIERGTSDDKILLVADNKDYKSQEIELGNVEHLFKVVAHLGIL